MPFSPKRVSVLITLAAAAVGLGGCVEHLKLSSDYGEAVRQNNAAQIVDPDPRYPSKPAPGSGGARTALAQTRYDTGTVLKPAETSRWETMNQNGSSGGH
jgi:hypothetical protein